MTLDLDTVDLSQAEAVIETEKGEMRIEFYPDKAPRTVRNFLELAGKGYYDGLIFHRVIKGFMIQGGCPRGDGTGGPGYCIPAEFNDLEHRRGVVSMARSQDPDSAGSQFFIVHAEHVPSLDGQYTGFGKVVEGLDVLDSLASVETTWGPGGERSRPAEPLRIERIAIRLKPRAEDEEREQGPPADEEDES